MVTEIKIDGIDCANCCAKMEEGIRKLPGVINAEISFMSQVLHLECDEGDLPELKKKIKKICSKIEPGCSLDF